VPNTSLISIASPSFRQNKTTARFSKSATVHGRLAAYFALRYQEEDSGIRPWQDVWPTKEEFEAIMPAMWGEELRECLSADGKG
jgi:hypothetical protein